MILRRASLLLSCLALAATPLSACNGNGDSAQKTVTVTATTGADKSVTTDTKAVSQGKKSSSAQSPTESKKNSSQSSAAAAIKPAPNCGDFATSFVGKLVWNNESVKIGDTYLWTYNNATNGGHEDLAGVASCDGFGWAMIRGETGDQNGPTNFGNNFVSGVILTYKGWIIGTNIIEPQVTDVRQFDSDSVTVIAKMDHLTALSPDQQMTTIRTYYLDDDGTIHVSDEDAPIVLSGVPQQPGNPFAQQPLYLDGQDFQYKGLANFPKDAAVKDINHTNLQALYGDEGMILCYGSPQMASLPDQGIRGFNVNCDLGHMATDYNDPNAQKQYPDAEATTKVMGVELVNQYTVGASELMYYYDSPDPTQEVELDQWYSWHGDHFYFGMIRFGSDHTITYIHPSGQFTQLTQQGLVTGEWKNSIQNMVG